MILLVSSKQRFSGFVFVPHLKTQSGIGLGTVIKARSTVTSDDPVKVVGN